MSLIDSYNRRRNFTFGEPSNKRRNGNGIPVRRVRCKTNGRTYDSAKEAAKKLKISLSSISKSCIKDEPRQGLLFEYVT